MDDIDLLQPGSFSLLVAPAAAGARLLNGCAARLALKGSLRVLDGENRFDAYTIARLVRQHTPLVETVLQRIAVARAFTCQQILALLSSLPESSEPVLVMGLLASFADENVPIGERSYLLRGCLAQLKRLARCAPVLVSAQPAHSPAERRHLLALSAAAGRTWRMEDTPPPSPPPERLC